MALAIDIMYEWALVAKHIMNACPRRQGAGILLSFHTYVVGSATTIVWKLGTR